MKPEKMKKNLNLRIKKICFLFAFAIIIAGTVSNTLSAQSLTQGAAAIVDKTKATIKGKVECKGKPIEGVRVSDGVITTTTDKDGYYWLPSAKHHGYVFIVIPSGYQPVSECKVTPAFWASLQENATTCEQHNFELEKVDNDNHIILAAADFHLANRKMTSTNDMNQFRDGFLDETTRFINEQTLPVYTLVLGDMTWDYFWYSNNYMPQQYKETMSGYPSLMFHVMGNHDNDPYVADDFLSEIPYKKVLGPSYYSMNIGKVHYIILDNTIYLNDGGEEGKIGKRNYKRAITDIQIQWLKEDLAAIKDKSTPIVVAFHCPSAMNYTPDFTNQYLLENKKATRKFYDLFYGFANVQMMSGHTHVNANMEFDTNISMEHNIAAVCETWWWSAKLSGLNLCKDGSPSGYKIFDVKGKDFSWYYKGIYNARNKQFRTYDMNNVKTVLKDSEIAAILAKIDNGTDNELIRMPDNSVLINVWDYDSKWKISVKEDGKPLEVQRVYARDPLHRRYYEYLRSKQDGKAPGKEFCSMYNSHMFLVKTQSPKSTLDIVVTDRFGNQYKETMIRPKQFTASMD